MSGWRLFVGWVAFVVVAYVLARIFIVPPTDEARAVASVLFAFTGAIAAIYGYIIRGT